MPAPRTANTYQIALRLLARRELSSNQLRERLVRRELPAVEIETAITRLTHNGAVDDGRVAHAYARRAAEVKFRGKRRTRREIEALGIDAETAGQAVADVFSETDEETVLEHAIDKRLDGPVRDRAQFRRLYQSLLRQGFPTDRIVAQLLSRAEGNGTFVEE